MRYMVEEYEPGRYSIVEPRGGILYDDVSDLYEEQREMLAQLHSENEDMDWETAWGLIQQQFPEHPTPDDFIPRRWYVKED